jgi:hypothetical protein
MPSLVAAERPAQNPRSSLITHPIKYCRQQTDQTTTPASPCRGAEAQKPCTYTSSNRPVNSSSLPRPAFSLASGMPICQRRLSTAESDVHLGALQQIPVIFVPPPCSRPRNNADRPERHFFRRNRAQAPRTSLSNVIELPNSVAKTVQ